jgi:hypothetical protein
MIESNSDTQKVTILKEIRGVVERELSYREHLYDREGFSERNNPIVACREILCAIDCRIRAAQKDSSDV